MLKGSEVLLDFDLSECRIVLTLAGKSDSRRLSFEENGRGGVIKSIGDCGSPGPGENPGPGPQKCMKTIGVLGGMGPESTAMFYQELIKQCQKQYGAQYDKDYPEILIYNLPIPDIVEGLGNPERVLPALIEGIKRLESIGVDFITMPCNTAEYFYRDMKKEISIPFLSIIEETAKKVKSVGYKKVGLLATETTIVNGNYNSAFEKFEIGLVVPEEQDKVTRIILNILAGKKLEKDKEVLKTIIRGLKNKGAEAIILGCTDIPVLLKQDDVNVEVFNTIEVLAESTIRYATGFNLVKKRGD